MNMIRFITEHEFFVGDTIHIIETCIHPLLRFADKPELIDFDDDLVFCIDAIIKKSKGCSTIMQELFPYLMKFQDKYGGLLANLTNCLNSFIVFGREFIESSEENVSLLLQMAWRAITINPSGAADHPLMTGENCEY